MLPSKTRVAAKQRSLENQDGIAALQRSYLLAADCASPGSASPTTAKVMKDEPVAKSFKTSAPKVIVETFAGSITVTCGDDATVDGGSYQ